MDSNLDALAQGAEIRSKVDVTPKRAAFYVTAQCCNDVLWALRSADIPDDIRNEAKRAIEVVLAYARGSENSSDQKEVIARARTLDRRLGEAWKFESQYLTSATSFLNAIDDLRKIPELKSNAEWIIHVHRMKWSLVAIWGVMMMVSALEKDDPQWRDFLAKSMVRSSAAYANAVITPLIEKPNYESWQKWVLRKLSIVNRQARALRMDDTTPFGDKDFEKAKSKAESGCAAALSVLILVVGCAAMIVQGIGATP